MGIAFGLCSSCTPKEYKDAAAQVAAIQKKAIAAWDEKDAGKAMRRAEKRRKFIEKQERLLGIDAAKDDLHEIEMKHHHSYRYMHEQAEKKAKEAP
ncbi:hypothetical protein DSS3P8_076 [Roseobacter phage DSS3P8]|nr:hypothetical protein DSS3P8_076 [Roseobacter phage DSS3P8]